MATYADFSGMGKDKRYGTIGEFEFDFTNPPLSVILFLNKRTAERKREGLGVLYEDYYEALYMWLKAQNSDITKKWMENNLNSTQFQQVVFAVFLDVTNVPLVKFEEKNPKLPMNREMEAEE